LLSTWPPWCYRLLACCAVAGIVAASLSFGSRVWASLLSTGLQAVVLVMLLAVDAVNQHADFKTHPVGIGLGVLAMVFTSLGVAQARRYRAWRLG
jgi:hypothetical protein